MVEVMAEFAETFDPMALERIGGTTGGSTTFELPDPMEPEKIEKTDELVGVVLHSHPARSYWAGGIDGGRTPPDCSSIDGVHGSGVMASQPDVRGLCDLCPAADFGSKNNDGSGKGMSACGARTWLYLYRGESFLPMLINMPPTSQKSWRRFRTALLSRAVGLNSVVVRISLARVERDFPTAEYRFAVVARVPDEIRPKLNELSKVLAEATKHTERPEPAPPVVDTRPYQHDCEETISGIDEVLEDSASIDDSYNGSQSKSNTLQPDEDREEMLEKQAGDDGTPF
jgi:hypothetical protein